MPAFIVVTKIDIAPPNVLENTLKILFKMLKAPGSKKLPFVIKSEDDVLLAARNIASERYRITTPRIRPRACAANSSLVGLLACVLPIGLPQFSSYPTLPVRVYNIYGPSSICYRLEKTGRH